MDFGSMMSGLVTNAGYVQIAGAEQQQRQATADNTRASADMHKMQALAMQQDMHDREGLASDAKGEEQRFAASAKTDKDSLDHYTKMAEMALNHHQFGAATAYENLAKNKEAALKSSIDAQMRQKADKSNALGAAAIDYTANPSEEGYQQLRDAAIAAGKDPKTIPQYGDPKLIGAARSWMTEGKDNEKRVEHMDNVERIKREDEAKAKYQEEQQKIERERIAATLRAREEGIAAANARAADARVAKERLELDRQRFKVEQDEKKGHGGKVGAIEQKISDTVIRNAAQGVRVLDNMMEVSAKASQSVFAKIKDTTLTDALLKTGGNIMTSEQDQAVTAIGAEMGVIVGQIVTAGSGRGAALPIVQSFQDMTTPKKGDTQHMKLLRVANAGEIIKLELENITPGATPELEKHRTDMIEMLKKLPSTKDVLRIMPSAGKTQTMGQFKELMEKSRELQNKASSLPKEGEEAKRTGETKTLGGVTYHRTAAGGWEHD